MQEAQNKKGTTVKPVKTKSQPSSKIYICFLPKGKTQRDVREMFQKFGSIKHIRVDSKQDGFTFSYITYQSIAQAGKAIQQMDKYKIDDRILKVSYALSYIPGDILEGKKNSNIQKELGKKKSKMDKKQMKGKQKLKQQEQKPGKIAVSTQTQSQVQMIKGKIQKKGQNEQGQEKCKNQSLQKKKISLKNRQHLDIYKKWLKQRMSRQSVESSFDNLTEESLSTKESKASKDQQDPKY